MKKILTVLVLSLSMLTAFADNDENENRGRNHDNDDYACVIPETSTYAAIGFMGVVVGTVMWNKRRNK